MSLENPNWHDFEDRKLYNELFYRSDKKTLTEEEERFCRMMYHFEEYASGLDG